ncbi:MAG TPA: hypothetical protein VJQ49_03175 [Casimicrobiaceae bacterium]|nr:hypothetical protein [Casimicrobiaceae bacterium]
MPSPRAAVAGPKHEVADVSGRRILWTAAGLAAMLVVVALAAWAVLSLLGSGRQPDTSISPAATSRMPTPRLQSSPSRDLRALREEKQAMLNEYRWLDRKAGVVQIPIARAMELLVARGERRSHPADAAPGGKR